MRRSGFRAFAIVATTALAAAAAVAQQAGGPTYGPCAAGRKETDVSCLTKDERIRIARFAGALDKAGGARLEEFIGANPDRIVRLDISVDDGDEIYGAGSANDAITGTFSFPAEDGGGHAYNILAADGAPSPVESANGVHRLRGYFLVRPVMGMHQGWIETALEPVRDQDVLLSDKFEAD